MNLYYVETMVTGESKLFLVDEILYQGLHHFSKNDFKLHDKKFCVSFKGLDEQHAVLDIITNKYILCYLKPHIFKYGTLYSIDFEKHIQTEL